MYEIGDHYRHIITHEIVQIYFIYRSTANKQIRIFDLVSAISKPGESNSLDMHMKLKKMNGRDIRTWHMTIEEFERYFDAV